MNSLYWAFSQDEEAVRWREVQQRIWHEAARLEQEAIEDANRAYEQQALDTALGELQGVVYAYLMDHMTEEAAKWEMYHLGFNPDDLEQLALDMIDTL